MSPAVSSWTPRSELNLVAVDSAEELLKILPVSDETDDSLRIVIYFDEAHVLHHRTTKETGQVGAPKTSYRILTSAFSHLYVPLSKAISFNRTEFSGFISAKLSMFLVVLSTNPCLDRMAPSRPLFWSSRIYEASRDQVQAPITELPFDVFPSEALILENDKNLLDYCEMSSIVKFGRPL